MNTLGLKEGRRRAAALLTMRPTPRHKWLVAASSVVVVVLLGLYAFIQTHLTLNSLKKGELDGAARHARRARLVSQPLSFITFSQVPVLETWNQGLRTIVTGHHLTTQLQQYLRTSLGYKPQARIEAILFQSKLTEFTEQLQLFLTSLDRSPGLKRLVDQHLQSQNLSLEKVQTELVTLLSDVKTVSTQLMVGQHRYLVLFQNSHELRATGGFMGSYAQVELNSGQIAEIKVQDIYEPDGQFQGYVAAPPGVSEYLSSGQGLRLPDANWQPDFPSSAQTILNYFALGNKQAVDGVVAINLTVAEKLLTITGDLYLPDYQVTVTADNLAEVARADRDQFFPGSQAKPHFLSALFTQLKLRLEQLTPTQQRAVARLVTDSIATKDLQFYSTNEQLQALFHQYDASGEMNQLHSEGAYLFLVESNVGINKANQQVTRQVRWELGEYRSHLAIEFKNNHALPATPASPLGQLLQPSQSASAGATQPYHYVNYQRVIIPADHRVSNLTVNGRTLPRWDEAVITTTQGQQFKQIGFLVTVLAQNSATVSLDIVSPRPLTTPLAVEIQRQSGLPPTPYTLTWDSEEYAFVLEKDEVLTF